MISTIKTHELVILSNSLLLNFDINNLLLISTIKTHVLVILSNSLLLNFDINNLLKEMYGEIVAEVLEEIQECSKSIYENLCKEFLFEMYEEV